MQTCWDDARLVENEDILGPQTLGDVGEGEMLDTAVLAIEHHQP